MNRYEATVESYNPDDAFAWLRIEGGRLAARAWPGIHAGERAAVRLRADDVLLAAEPPGRISARNVLPGHVASVKRVPEGVYVTVDVGFPIVALVTRRAAADLGLVEGARTFAIVKANAVVPVSDAAPKFRVAVVGREGLIDPDKLDFLRAIGRTGSISAAGREFGISWRTAWQWAETVNRLWGAPLLSRTRAGAQLTPEGVQVLELAAEKEGR